MLSTLVFRDTKLAAQNPPPETLAALRAEPGVMLWVDLAAPTDDEIKAVLEIAFGFHPLTIEDCVADSPFPKLEDYGDYLYLVMHAVDYSKAEQFTTTELDLFLSRNFLVTFHRQPLKPVQAALERYTRTPGQVVRGPDRFAHVILDLIVEAYKPALAELQQSLDELEEGVLKAIDANELFPQVVELRKEFSRLRQIVRPQREIAAELAAGKAKFIRPVVLPYLRDLSEELSRIESQSIAWAEQLILSFRIYLNKSGYEANRGIRILTGITAVTLPSLIIGGWFGMNFTGMRELQWPFGYVATGAAMLGGTFMMFRFMRKKHWL